MRFATLIPLILFSYLFSVESAQQANRQTTPRYAAVPPENVLLTIAAQPECPIRIENLRLLYNLDTNQLSYSFEIRNRGTQPVTGFFLDAWFANGTGGTIIYDWEKQNKTLMPGRSATELEIDERQIVPLSKDVKERMQLKSGMRMVVVLIVRYVNFSDGLSWNALKTSDALSEYFIKLGESNRP